jgi:hypothetical protein
LLIACFTGFNSRYQADLGGEQGAPSERAMAAYCSW